MVGFTLLAPLFFGGGTYMGQWSRLNSYLKTFQSEHVVQGGTVFCNSILGGIKALHGIAGSGFGLSPGHVLLKVASLLGLIVFVAMVTRMWKRRRDLDWEIPAALQIAVIVLSPVSYEYRLIALAPLAVLWIASPARRWDGALLATLAASMIPKIYFTLDGPTKLSTLLSPLILLAMIYLLLERPAKQRAR